VDGPILDDKAELSLDGYCRNGWATAWQLKRRTEKQTNPIIYSHNIIKVPDVRFVINPYS
jgi:hypothetical protein